MENNEIWGRLDHHIQESIKKRAIDTRASQIGQIVAVNSGQRVDVKTSDGRLWENLGNCNPGMDLSVGKWVTFEWNGLSYYVVGTSPSFGGNLV